MLPFATQAELESQSTWHATVPLPPIAEPQDSPIFTVPEKLWYDHILPSLNDPASRNFSSTCREALKIYYQNKISPTFLNHIGTDGSADPVTGLVGAAVAGQHTTGPWTWRFKIPGIQSNPRAEGFAILAALILTPLTQPLVIWTDSKSTNDALDSIEKAEQAKLNMTRVGRSLANYSILAAIRFCISQRKSRNTPTQICWVRAHPAGGPSSGPEHLNDHADKAANAARLGNTNLVSIPECYFFLPQWYYRHEPNKFIIEGPSHSIVRTEIGHTIYSKNPTVRKCTSHRQTEAAAATTATNLPKNTLSKMWRTSPADAMFAYRMLYGGFTTPTVRHTLYCKKYPLAFTIDTCPLCKVSPATQAHIFCVCPATATLRRQSIQNAAANLHKHYVNYGFDESRAAAWLRTSCLFHMNTWLPNSSPEMPAFSLGLIPPQALAALKPFLCPKKIPLDSRHSTIQQIIWHDIFQPIWKHYKNQLERKKLNFSNRLTLAYPTLTPANARRHRTILEKSTPTVIRTLHALRITPDTNIVPQNTEIETLSATIIAVESEEAHIQEVSAAHSAAAANLLAVKDVISASIKRVEAGTKAARLKIMAIQAKTYANEAAAFANDAILLQTAYTLSTIKHAEDNEHRYTTPGNSNISTHSKSASYSSSSDSSDSSSSSNSESSTNCESKISTSSSFRSTKNITHNINHITIQKAQKHIKHIAYQPKSMKKKYEYNPLSNIDIQNTQQKPFNDHANLPPPPVTTPPPDSLPDPHIQHAQSP